MASTVSGCASADLTLPVCNVCDVAIAAPISVCRSCCHLRHIACPCACHCPTVSLYWAPDDIAQSMIKQTFDPQNIYSDGARRFADLSRSLRRVRRFVSASSSELKRLTGDGEALRRRRATMQSAVHQTRSKVADAQRYLQQCALRRYRYDKSARALHIEVDAVRQSIALTHEQYAYTRHVGAAVAKEFTAAAARSVDRCREVSERLTFLHRSLAAVSAHTSPVKRIALDETRSRCQTLRADRRRIVGAISNVSARTERDAATFEVVEDRRERADFERFKRQIEQRTSRKRTHIADDVTIQQSNNDRRGGNNKSRSRENESLRFPSFT